jgi:Spy/CpxP family protein refolding chaperone
MNGKIPREVLVAGLLFACASPALTHAQSGPQDSGQNQTATTPAQNASAGPNLNLTDEQQAQ